MDTQKTIQYIAITAALVLAPLVTYGSAMLMDRQSGNVSESSVKLVKTPIEKTEALSEDIVSKISESISLLDRKS
ncbi:MAG: hypothetical protein ACRBCS_07595 [Cellvibrionaceae bacterium]